MTASKIEDPALQKAYFLATIGGPGYKLLRSLSGNDTKSKSFADLIKLMSDHLNPKPNPIAQRFHFYKRDRKSTESVNEYIAELRKLSEHCGFGANLSEYLRDRFVCGLNSESVQQKLLTMKTLSLDTALETARTFEAAYKDTRAIRGSGGAVEPEGILKLGSKGRDDDRRESKGRDDDRRECFRCGYTGHLANTCQFKTSECHNCGKVGHIRRRCRSERKESGSVGGRKVGVKTFGLRDQGSSDGGGMDELEGDIDFLNLYSLSQRSAGGLREPVMVEVRVNGKEVRMEVDTGAAVSVMSVSAYGMIKKEERIY